MAAPWSWSTCRWKRPLKSQRTTERLKAGRTPKVGRKLNWMKGWKLAERLKAGHS
jgi:hypothetical protein